MVAQEQYLYEKYRDETLISAQPLITPKPLFFTPRQESLAIEHSSLLKRVGFDVRRLDQGWALVGSPQLRGHVLDQSDLEETLVLIGDNRNKIPFCKRMKAVFASKACRTAVMIGDPLTQKDMESIVRSMANVKQPWNCPHGRPTIRLLTQVALETV